MVVKCDIREADGTGIQPEVAQDDRGGALSYRLSVLWPHQDLVEAVDDMVPLVHRDRRRLVSGHVLAHDDLIACGVKVAEGSVETRYGPTSDRYLIVA